MKPIGNRKDPFRVLGQAIVFADVTAAAEMLAASPKLARERAVYGAARQTAEESFLWRPLPSSGRYATPIRGLWHIGASTHPGAGLGGGSGHMAATTLIRRTAWRG
jgi:phytoene dehydrogenase-like protein